MHRSEARRFEMMEQFMGHQKVEGDGPGRSLRKPPSDASGEVIDARSVQSNPPERRVVLGIDHGACLPAAAVVLLYGRSQPCRERQHRLARMARGLSHSDLQRGVEVKIALFGRQQGKETVSPQLLPRNRLDLEGFLHRGGVYWEQSADPLTNVGGGGNHSMHRSLFLSCYRIGRHFAVGCGLMLLSLPLFAQASTPPPQNKPKPPPKPVKTPAVDRARGILRAEHQQLFRGNLEFRNVGANIPDLFERFLSADDATAEKMLTDAQTAGVRFVRCFGTTWGPERFGLFETDHARWLTAFDRMLLAADRHGITVVPSLLFNIRMLPEYVQRKTGRQEGVVGYLTPGTASNLLAVAYVTAIVTRYRTDPRVLFWEIGNEYNLEADLSLQSKSRPLNAVPTSDQIRAFLAQIAKVIKRVDRKHLVTSGNSDMRPAAWHLREAMLAHASAADPLNFPMDWTKDTLRQYTLMIGYFNPAPLDLVSVHQYAPDPLHPEESAVSWLLPDNNHAVMLSWARVAAQRLQLPLFVGEFGETFFEDGKAKPALWTQDFMSRIPLGTAPIAAVWAWEFAQDGKMTPHTLAPETTPGLISLLTTTNRTILNDIIGGSPIVAPLPK